jgi:cupin 2 domain-containing protein
MDGVKIERIVSNGQPSPTDFWYEQEQDEWVTLIQGAATLEFKHGEKKEMQAGDYLLIPSHLKHRVSKVSRDGVWLEIHFL